MAAALALAAGGHALAADLPQPGPPPPRAPATYVPVPVPVFTWSGVYIGVNGGYAFGTSNWNDPVDGPTGNFNTTGYLAGGTVGGNYQWGQFVFGVEGDWDWSNLNGTSFTNCIGGCETKSDWLATARFRAGYAWDRILFYGTGGGAFGNLQAGWGTYPFSSSTQIGWTAGAGVEFALSPNWTAKVEYLYVDLGNQSCAFANCAGGYPSTSVATAVTLTENVVRVGVNYKFW